VSDAQASGLDLSALNFEKGGGLVTVIAQDAATGRVLMVAHADRAALTATLATGEMHYHSRSRGLWHKGATSGNTQRVVSLTVDCDGDAVLARIAPRGPACHTGAISCFDHGVALAGGDALSALDATLASRAVAASAGASPSSSYTTRLLTDRNLRLKKLGEESAELVAACADGDRARATEEAADLLYHTFVALRALDIDIDAVRRVLAARASAPTAPSVSSTPPPHP
jgi:phosphoribosyl-ATP pyrophosphohydrolase/phosphoribosyl-AMP cyclohydrolase